MRTPSTSAKPLRSGSSARDESMTSAVITSGRHAGLEGAHGVGRQGLAAEAPVTALDLVDHDPGHAAHVLTLDLNHRVGELLDHLRLLVVVEDTFDETDVDEGHTRTPLGRGKLVVRPTKQYGTLPPCQ